MNKIIISLPLLTILAAAAIVITTGQAQAQLQLQQPPPTTPGTADSNGNVSILSSSQIGTEFGSTYIVGEVRNNLSDVVEFVQIVGRFYDSNGVLIDTDFTYTDLDLLRPGERSPFSLIITDESVAQRIDNYTLAANWDTVFADPAALAAATVLTIQEGEHRINDNGWYEIVGEVVNGGTDDTEFVKVVATFYDEAGQVIYTDYTYTDPSDIPAGQSAPFELMVTDEDISEDIESVKLSAQSQDYFVIDPELAATTTTTPTMAQQQQQQQPPPVVPAPSSSSVPADYIEVRSDLFGATISHPPDWQVRPPYNSPHGFSLLHVFAPEGEGGFSADKPNFNVEVAEGQGAMADYEARAWLEQRAFELMTLHEHFEIIESAPTTLVGQPGWMIKYTFTSMIDGTEMTHTQAMGGVAGRTYLLTYSSPADLYDEYLPQVQNMLNSFRVE